MSGKRGTGAKNRDISLGHPRGVSGPAPRAENRDTTPRRPWRLCGPPGASPQRRRHNCAISGGVGKRLLEHGCPLRYLTCRDAASNGQLEVRQLEAEAELPGAIYHLAFGRTRSASRELGGLWSERRVKPPFWAGTWRCCSGRGSTAARGTRACVTSAVLGGHLSC
jgi:hypothetical protein